MPAPSDILKNFNIFVDGRGYAGQADEVQLPKLTIKTEDMQSGGLDSPVGIDMGMEKMEASFVLSKFDRYALSLWGVFGSNPPALVVRGATSSLDGTVKAVVAVLRGAINEIDPGAWKAGEKATTAFKMHPVYYRLEIDGSIVHEIDVLGMKRIVGGVDYLQAIRTAIGA